MNTNWHETPYFSGLDWATEHHDIIVVDRFGAVVSDFQFYHSLEGWKQFDEQIRCLGKRWLKILWRLWINRTAYEEPTYLASTQKHGSFVSGMLATSSASACE